MMMMMMIDSHICKNVHFNGTFPHCFVSRDELRRLQTEKEALQKEAECLKAEQIKERDEEKRQHKCVPVGVRLILNICWIRNSNFKGNV